MNIEMNHGVESQQLCHANNALSDLIEESPYATHLKDAQTGQYIQSNSKFAEYIGITPIESVQGLTIESSFDKRQWTEKVNTPLFRWWKDTEPKKLLQFDDEVQMTQQRIKKQRLSITSAGLILFKETVKTPVLNQDSKKVIAILTQSQDITWQCNLFALLNMYKKCYADQETEAVRNMLIFLDIDGYFAKLPNLGEMNILLALHYGLSDNDSDARIHALQQLTGASYWYEMLTRLRTMPINAH